MKNIEHRIINGQFLVTIEWEWMQEWANVEGKEAEAFATVIDVALIKRKNDKIRITKPYWWQTLEISKEIRDINSEKIKEVYKG